MSDLAKRKEKVLSIIQEKGYYSLMNSTKWQALKAGVSKLPFQPPYVIKGIDELETEYHKFDKDVFYTSDWGLYLDNYLGGDMYATPFFVVEWIKVRPRILKSQGRLIPNKVIDITEKFISILKECNIPFEEDNGVFIIYGYKLPN